MSAEIFNKGKIFIESALTTATDWAEEAQNAVATQVDKIQDNKALSSAQTFVEIIPSTLSKLDAGASIATSAKKFKEQLSILNADAPAVITASAESLRVLLNDLKSASENVLLGFENPFVSDPTPELNLKDLSPQVIEDGVKNFASDLFSLFTKK